MDRSRAFEELKVRLTNNNLVKHSLAVEAIMKELAAYLKEDVNTWGMAGLMHDIDYDKTAGNPAMHSIMGAEILDNIGFDPEIVYAVKAHNDYHGIERKRKIDKALYCADPVSGMITASALILPAKKLEAVTVDFVISRMGEKSFAKGANRDQIRKCSDLGLSLEAFIELSLKAMKGISGELGL